MTWELLTNLCDIMRPKHKKIIDNCVEIILEVGEPLPTSILTERLKGRMPNHWLPKSNRETANILAKRDRGRKLLLIHKNPDSPNNRHYLWTVREDLK